MDAGICGLEAVPTKVIGHKVIGRPDGDTEWLVTVSMQCTGEGKTAVSAPVPVSEPAPAATAVSAAIPDADAMISSAAAKPNTATA